MIFKAVLSDNARADGTRNIRVYIYDNVTRRKAYVSTEYYCHKDNFAKGKVKNQANASFINSKVSKKVVELEEQWLKNSKLLPVNLKSKSGSSMLSFIEGFMKGIKSGKVLNDGKNFSPNTIANYKTYTDHLKEFRPKLDWVDITDKFYDEYVNYLREKGYMDNSITKAIKILKTIMNKGREFHSNNAYHAFKAVYRESESLALTEAEIEKIMSVKLPDHLDRERDRFYLSYNLLLRFGDSIKLDKSNLIKKKGKWLVQITHEKTGTKAIIPLFEKSLEILKKYNYHLPATTNQESNWKLKEIGEKAGIDEAFTVSFVKGNKKVKQTLPRHKFITTHTARRSMATNLYLNGVDLKQIQLMGGWKSMAMLERYLKVDKLENALKASEHPFFN